MSCHVRGVIDKADEVRERVEKRPALYAKEEAASIRALYPEHEDFQDLLKTDARRFVQALESLKGPATATDPILALVQRYEAPLDLKAAAAEVGVRPDELRTGLRRSAALGRSIGLLEDDQTVRREVLDDHFGELVRELLARAEPYRPGKNQIVNSIGMRLRLIPEGRFRMGSPAREEGRRNDEGTHDVEITRRFFIGAYEVTQKEYSEVMGNNPSYFAPGGKGKVANLDTSRFPVDSVSWEDARKFCEKLSQLPEEKRQGRKYRLPTEAEWEYACRGRSGADSPFNVGSSLDGKLANVGRTRQQTAEVGTSGRPNDFGLYDMHGNVGEWCEDRYDDKYYGRIGSERDPQGPGDEVPDLRVRRGGSWQDDAADCRSAARHNSGQRGVKSNTFGFRVVLEAPAKEP
jgi:formylglycine-generating enzyme required for sulfatase activity